MRKDIISTDKAPEAIGAYVQAVKSHGILFISGQLGFNMPDGHLSETLEEQTLNALKNLECIMKAAGSDKSKVLKTTIFLTDMENFEKVNKIYEAFFEGQYPARSCVAVKELPKMAKVEIECMVATD
ncbi:MAG: RidA family protein [Lachnospiraceae bacterium]|nr:RidA family protein [Lachnospiraceae bacterium]